MEKTTQEKAVGFAAGVYWMRLWRCGIDRRRHGWILPLFCPSCGAKFQINREVPDDVIPSMLKVHSRCRLLVNVVSFANEATLRKMGKEYETGLFTGTVLYWSHDIHGKYYAVDYSRIALYITWIRSKALNPWICLLGNDLWHIVCSFIFPPVIGCDSMKYKCRICKADTSLFGLDKDGYAKHWWKCTDNNCKHFTHPQYLYDTAYHASAQQNRMYTVKRTISCICTVSVQYYVVLSRGNVGKITVSTIVFSRDTVLALIT